MILFKKLSKLNIETEKRFMIIHFDTIGTRFEFTS